MEETTKLDRLNTLNSEAIDKMRGDILSSDSWTIASLKQTLGLSITRDLLLGDGFHRLFISSLFQIHPTLPPDKQQQLVEKQQAYEKELQLQAEIDPKTRLHRYESFKEKTREKLEIYNKGYIILIDLDKFKTANDSFGHPFGDTSLAALGESISKNFPEPTVAGRFGGEEIALFVPEEQAPNQRDLVEIINNVRADYYNSVPENRVNADFQGFFSAGVFCADFTNRSLTLEEALEKAGNALYLMKEKAQGRNGTQFGHRMSRAKTQEKKNSNCYKILPDVQLRSSPRSF